MKISLTDAGKRYNREWIFRHLTHTFHTGNNYAITGSNGSGKSTLLQVISGALHISEGMIRLNDHPVEDIYHLVSIAAPYLELIEEMTGKEFLTFHQSFKPFLEGYTPQEILTILELGHAADKQIRYYSSGMKQRLKLGQAILSNCPFVLLDEPCTNLDIKGIQLYHQLISSYTGDRCVIVSSNDLTEYEFCTDRIDIQQYKPA